MPQAIRANPPGYSDREKQEKAQLATYSRQGLPAGAAAASLPAGNDAGPGASAGAWCSAWLPAACPHQTMESKHKAARASTRTGGISAMHGSSDF